VLQFHPMEQDMFKMWAVTLKSEVALLQQASPFSWRLFTKKMRIPCACNRMGALCGMPESGMWIVMYTDEARPYEEAEVHVLRRCSDVQSLLDAKKGSKEWDFDMSGGLLSNTAMTNEGETCVVTVQHVDLNASGKTFWLVVEIDPEEHNETIMWAFPTYRRVAALIKKKEKYNDWKFGEEGFCRGPRTNMFYSDDNYDTLVYIKKLEVPQIETPKRVRSE